MTAVIRMNPRNLDPEEIRVRGEPMADYHCPMCHTLSTEIWGKEEAYCTKTECPVSGFNPSAAPDAPLCEAVLSIRREDGRLYPPPKDKRS